jgi:FkbM family methyltransferase
VAAGTQLARKVWGRAFGGLLQKRRHRTWVRFYGTFVSSGDLVFDVGAHVGTRTAAFVELGARVVAVEPQPECVKQLERQFASNGAVTIVPAGLAAETGTRQLFHAGESTLASMSPEFQNVTADSGRFGDIIWSAGEQVRTTTLDALIAEHGVPRFCKIDVEGLEAEVLAGVTAPLPLVSFEFVAERPEAAEACLDRLEALGSYRLNFVVADENRFHLEQWVDRAELKARLAAHPDALLWGDVYAKL